MTITVPKVCVSHSNDVLALQGRLEEHCHVVLRFKMSGEYPLAPPAVMVAADARGLSDSKVAELMGLLEKRAKELAGEVMVTDLAMAASNWLTSHNQPPLGSFYEEMQANRRRQSQLDMERIQRVKELNQLKEKQEQEEVSCVF
jgi:hypothetical protein